MATNNRTRVPPHDLDAEESVLGAMLLSAAAIDTAGGIVGPDDFYKPAHGHIADAITEAAGAGEAVGPVTVAASLRARGLLDEVGGTAALTALQSGAPSTSGVGTYARIVAEHARRRRMLGLAAELAECAYAGDDEGAERAVSLLSAVPAGGRARLEVEDVTAAVRGDEPAVLPTVLRFG